MPDVIGIDRFDDKLRFARWKKKWNNETATQWGARHLHFIEHVGTIVFKSSGKGLLAQTCANSMQRRAISCHTPAR